MEWLSIVEYARKYQISDMTIRRRIKTGKLKAELKDGKYYIPAGQESRHLEAEPKLTQPEKVTVSATPIPQTYVQSKHDVESTRGIEIEDVERMVKKLYETKLAHLESMCMAKDLRIKELEQNVEDLTLLVKILEKK
jgi:hypothetical protein